MPRTKAAAKKAPAVKTKTQSKGHPKKAAKAHAAAKPKARTKTKATKPKKAKSSTHVKARTVHKTHPKKRTMLSQPISKFEFSDTQTNTLLNIVEKIINLHKRRQSGLRSLYAINRILDKYNQHYTHPIDKLDAIIKYGMEKDPAVHHQHFYAIVNNRSKDEDDLYHLLSSIGHGKTKFEEAKNKMKAIYEESVNEK